MKILVAVDNSDVSRQAVEQVSRRPWPPGATFEVLHVVEPMHLWLNPDITKELALISDSIVEDSVEQLAVRGLTATGQILEGDPKRLIPDHAKKLGVDWIVVGSRGASGLTRLLLGSVSTAVLRHAPCSVEIARPRSGSPMDAWKLLLATDGSPSSELAAKSIARRPWPEGTEVRIISAVEFSTTPILGLLEPPGIDFKVNELRRAEGMKHSQDAVEKAGAIIAASCPQVSQSISVLVERPNKIILDEADKWQPDLIVVGSHGHSGMDRFLLGSVSDAVATYAHCSVEVVRAKSH